MRTKALFMAAAALAAGLLTSNAQVYSQNIVGYVSIPLTNATIQVVSPTLDFDGTGINNTVATVFGTNVAAGDVVYVFNGTGYNSLDYEPVSRSIPTAGWYLGEQFCPTATQSILVKLYFIYPQQTRRMFRSGLSFKQLISRTHIFRRWPTKLA